MTTSYHCETCSDQTKQVLTIPDGPNAAAADAHHAQEEVDVRPFVHQKAHRMPVDRHAHGEIVRRARLDDVALHRIVVRVDERLVQVEHERLALDERQAVAGDGRQREHVVLDGLVL